jgi:hypothetical protein
LIGVFKIAGRAVGAQTFKGLDDQVFGCDAALTGTPGARTISLRGQG